MIVFAIVATILFLIGGYLLAYWKFKKDIARQTKQMITLMKAEDINLLKVGNIYSEEDGDFSDLERAALNLRKKYLRLKRQSSEERTGYETVFSGLKEGIVTVDQDMKIISYNEAFSQFFKWQPKDDFKNTFLQDAVRDPEVIQTFKASFEQASIEKNEIENFQLFVTPLPSRVENQLWSMGVFYDLTEIRKTERIRIDFVANASHEMRTPLTVIKGYSELLEQGLKNKNLEKELEYLKPIQQSADQMADLMTDLLDLSRLETAHSLQMQWVDTKQVTDEAMQVVLSMANLNSKEINVKIDVEKVYGNANAVQQVLRNLLINAIKYSEDKKQVCVTWSENSENVLLSVKDNGPGISAEHQERIFERFYRVDKGRNRLQGGSGLGLSMVKHLMLAQKGQVRLLSEINKGCEFICEFRKP